METHPQVVRMPHARSTDPHAKRIRQLRRAYQKHLRCKPTTLLVAAMDHAARLVAKAEFAVLDPSVTDEDLVRLTNIASRAERKALDLIAERRKQERSPPSPFDALLGQRDRR